MILKEILFRAWKVQNLSRTSDCFLGDEKVRKHFWKNLKRKADNNRGMALVTVIVAIGFVAALVSILLMTTLVNFKMKVVNEKGADTFYSAEQVIDEITIGLQRIVSDSISSSYTYILENYGDSTLDNTRKKEMIQVKYYEKVWEALALSPSDHQKYDVEKLEAFLKDSTKYHTVDLDGDGTDEDGYGAILVAVTNDPSSGDKIETKYGDMLSFSDTGIVLKNLKVYYRDVNGFVSVIQTDIRLGYPEFDFARNSAVADVSDYCFIADGGAKRTNTGTLNIDGNIYANSFSTKGVKTTFTDKNLILVKHDINIDQESLKTGEGCAIWADSLKAKSANIEVDGALNLSNDLNLAGNSPSAKLVGEYNGYGCSIVDADDSSAILINGKETTVDFSGVTKLKISGQAFLGTSKASTVADHSYTTATYTDIYTGESVAAKSDQLMYLVPAEAIGVDEKTGRTFYNENPLTKQQYEKLEQLIAYDNTHADSATKYVMVSDTANVTALGGTLAPFIKYGASAQPMVYTHKVRVNDAATDYLVYFYMLFPDQDTAATYFSKYYESSERALAKYTKTYIKDVKFPNLTDSIFAGASYVTDATDAEVDGVRIWAPTQPTANLIMQQDATDNLQKFKAYTTKLIPNYSELRGCLSNDMDDPNSQVVFENVATTEDLIQAYIDRAAAAGCNGQTIGTVTVSIQASGKTMRFDDSSDGSVALISTDSSITVSNEDTHLVISSGDVRLTAPNFKGVILCNGELDITGSVLSMSKDADLVRKCLQFGYDDSGLTYAIASCLADGNDYIYATYGSGGTSDTALTGLVTYENWKKE